MKITLNEFINNSFIARNPRAIKEFGMEAVLISETGKHLSGKIHTINFTTPSSFPVHTQGLYIIREIGVGEFYVGSAGDVRRRKNVHLLSVVRQKHRNSSFQKAVNLLGPRAFEFQYFLANTVMGRKETRDVLYEFEQEILNNFHGNKNCFNHGIDVMLPMKGRSHSDSTKKLMSQNMRGIPKTDAYRRQMSEVRKGIPNTHKRTADSASRPVFLEGKAYTGTRQAAHSLQLPEHVIYTRLKSPKAIWKNWNYVDEIWTV